MEACAADPDNMIARLRAANCLERVASGAKDPERRFNGQVEALAAYTSIRIRRPSIFEAGFRASVLMSVLASEPVGKLAGSHLLEATLARFERATAKTVDPHDSSHDELPPVSGAHAHRRLEAAALTDGERQRQLRPLHTLRHEYRLRHRFEPTGRERRQLRKALGVSQMAQRPAVSAGASATGRRVPQGPARRLGGAPALVTDDRQVALPGVPWHIAG